MEDRDEESNQSSAKNGIGGTVLSRRDFLKLGATGLVVTATMAQAGELAEYYDWLKRKPVYSFPARGYDPTEFIVLESVNGYPGVLQLIVPGQEKPFESLVTEFKMLGHFKKINMDDLGNLPLKGEAIKINAMVNESLYRAANDLPDPGFFGPYGGTVPTQQGYIVGEDVSETVIPRERDGRRR
jgi:hypothetical protein